MTKQYYELSQAVKANRIHFETASKQFLKHENYVAKERKIISTKIDKNMSKTMTKKENNQKS